MAKVKAYRKDTGEIVRVPAHWLEHPELGKPFRKTPLQKSSEAAKQMSPERAGTAANPKSTHESANAGDDKKE